MLATTPLTADQFLGQSAAHLAIRLVLTATSVLVAAACFDAARRSTGSSRWGWGFLTAAAVGWALSNLVAAYAEVIQGRTLPVPSVADVPGASAALLSCAAIVALLGSVLPAPARMRTLLDGLLIAATLLFVSWDLILRDLYVGTNAVPERALAIGYPLADLSILAILLVSLSRLRPSRPWAMLLGGFGLHAISRTAFAYLEFADAADLGTGSVLWIIGALLIAAAALSGRSLERRLYAPRAGTAADVLIPCIPLAVALVIAARRLSEGPLEPFLLVNGAVIVVLLVARQLIAQVEYLQLYRQLETSVMHGVDVLTVMGVDGAIRRVTGPIQRTLGHRPEELIGTTFADLVHPGRRAHFLEAVRDAPEPPNPASATELMLSAKDGRWVLMETAIADLTRHPDVEAYLVTVRDTGKHRPLGDQLSPESLRDPLTGLGNRVDFLDRVRAAVHRSALTPELVTVVMIDLDGFTDLNDTLGHAVGDQLLVEVAARLGSQLGKGDTLARLGADEFGILLESDRTNPAASADRQLEQLRQPMELGGRSILVSACAGVAAGGFANPTADDLLRSADLALNRSKAAGRANTTVYDRDFRRSARQRVEVESDLRSALEAQQLVLHFQPIVDLASGTIAGAEALVRWDQPGVGLVAPSEFLAIAEVSDLAVTLGRWIVEEACRRAADFQAVSDTQPPFYVAVNMSGRQLADPQLTQQIRAAVDDAGLAPGSLVLEIPQTVLADEGDQAIGKLTVLRDSGIAIAIDDFGTGWSSLSRLRNFPVDKVKIDRPFIADVTGAEDEAPLLSAMIAMANSLGVVTIAEGVETVDQLAFLWRHRCSAAQGFGVYPPVPADDLIRTLQDHQLMLQTLPLQPLSADAQGYIDAVSGAVRAEAPLSEVVTPLLEQLRRITGGALAALTRDEPGGYEERVICGVGDGLQGMVLPLHRSPSAVVREGAERLVPDLQQGFARHKLAGEIGASWFLGAPVPGAADQVFGTLFVVGLAQPAPSHEVADLIDLLARLVANHPEVRNAPERVTATRRVIL